ncbi:MAG: response regulator transcription factor [Erysipelotrichaceae bacterium]|nr:response regulator transcription factor [Erysipelotrichaceae bacterium]
MEKLIYIIEDDDNIRDLIKIALNSYNFIVKDFNNAEEALKHVEEDMPQVAVFDLMLPGMDGISAVKAIRSKAKVSDLPVLILTARDSEVDKITGLEVGADDYMTKPFSVLELCARVKALIRRSKMKSDDSKIVSMGKISINQETRDVYRDGELIELTYKEYELLLLLMINHNQVLEREELLNKIWGYGGSEDTRTIDVHIRHLREKLGHLGDYIKTVRGVGYRFIGPTDEKDNI